MKYIISIIFLFLSACSLSTTTVQKTPLNLSDPKPLNLPNISFVVITEDNHDDVFRNLKKQNKQSILVGLDLENYKNLSIIMNDIKNYIILEKQILDKYNKNK